MPKTCPDGIDIYFDNVGGDILAACMEHLAMHARIVLCGSISEYMREEPFGLCNYTNLRMVNGTMSGFFVYNFEHLFDEATENLAEWIRSGRLKPVEDIVDGFDNIARCPGPPLCRQQRRRASLPRAQRTRRLIDVNNTDGIRFQRANYVVADLDRALTLYRDILGLSVEFIHESEPDSYSYPVFEIDKRAPLRFCVLSTATQPRVMALTEIRGVELPKAQFPRRAAIVLDVPNIDEVVSGCVNAGLRVYPEERLITHDGRTGREIGIVDADANLIVIYHIETHP